MKTNYECWFCLSPRILAADRRLCPAQVYSTYPPLTLVLTKARAHVSYEFYFPKNCTYSIYSVLAPITHVNIRKIQTTHQSTHDALNAVQVNSAWPSLRG